MLAKLTTKNQITLSKSIIRQVDSPEYFSVSLEEGRIVLTPVRVRGADAVRSKLAALGITEEDVDDAVRWARGGAR